jgi:uncharacterized protein YkwD
MPVTRTRARVFLAAALGALALGAAGAPAASAQNACLGAAGTPAGAPERALVGATLCLLNEQRASRHLHRLRLNRKLSKAARRHAEDMVRRTYFSHDTPSGTDFVERIRRTGYFGSAVEWMVGENIAWGSEDESTPQSIVQAWMQSPPHRHNILNRRFREIGIGVAPGAPESVEGPAATYATDFGLRH